MTSAFVCLGSIAIVSRVVAFLRSLETTGALHETWCYVLCLDHDTPNIIRNSVKSEKVQLITDKDITSIHPFLNRPIAELAYATKPFLIRWVMEQVGAEKVIYLDSDTWFIQNPNFLFDYLEEHIILLVPAVTKPEVVIEDWRTLSQVAQRTGYYNAGLVGCHQSASHYLDWWSDRCAHSTTFDFREDVNGDQKYLNWVPSLFPNVKILRHSGLNVKHFSPLHHKFARLPDGTPTLDNEPVIYFHFSQSLGNLLHWPQEFYPEVSAYLKALERARIDTGQPYVDMSRRDNSDLTRPLLPTEGALYRIKNLLDTYQEWVNNLKRHLIMSFTRGMRLAPRPIRERIVKRYVNKTALVHDAAIGDFARLAKSLTERRVTFLGISTLAHYLAYIGYEVTVYEPFQGHFNPSLNTLFNPQRSHAAKLKDLLSLDSQLTLKRQHPKAIADCESIHGTLVISAQRQMHDVLPVLEHCISRVSSIAVLYSPSWDLAYRAIYREQIKTVMPKNTACISWSSIDFYTLNIVLTETSSS